MTRSVSVLMVTHDHAKYIEEALASALAQGPEILEVVVVDDGSVDDTVERATAVGDPRIRILNAPHRGIAGLALNYNDGLEACRGDIVALLEGDDRWPSGKVARQVTAFDDPSVVLAHGLYSVIGAHGRVLHAGVRPSVRIPTGTYDARPYVLRASYIMAVTVLVRRSAVLRVGAFRQLASTPHWDYPTFLALSDEGPFHFDPIVLGEWRRHGTSATYRLARAGRAEIDRAVTQSVALALEARSRMRGAELPSEREITAAWREAEAQGVWQNARILLVGHRFSEARRLVGNYLWRPYTPAMRLRLVVAWVSAVVHVDLERVVTALRGRSALGELD